MIIKWETLKKRATIQASDINDYNWPVVAQALVAGIPDGSRWRDNIKAMRNQADDIIQQWDVRRAMKLVTAFPSILPKKYHTTTPVIDLNNSGKWVLYF